MMHIIDQKYEEKRTLWQIFEEDGPEAALERAFQIAESSGSLSAWPDKGRLFMWTSMMGNHGLYGYGSFKYVTRADLVGRKYEVQLSDGGCGLAIFWTDVVHDPKAYKAVPKPAQDFT